MSMYVRRPGLFVSLLVALLLPVPDVGLAAQEARSRLFREADRAFEAASAAQAELLAPKTFAEAIKHYQKAESELARGDLDRSRRELDAAARAFDQALDAAKLAEIVLAPAISARADAESAGADSFAVRAWIDAEKKFVQAAERLEDDDREGAVERGDEAEGLFRGAELDAIKANYLGDAWRTLEEARRLDAEKLAPRTFANAQHLASEAEAKLSESRYDTDEPRILAHEAREEAYRAIDIATRAARVKKGDETIEDALLAAEEPLWTVASTLDFPVSFAAGGAAASESVAYAVETKLESLQKQLAEREDYLVKRDERIAGLDERIAELVERIGGIEEEKGALTARLETQARTSQKFATVEMMFSRQEARVLREGDVIIIRLSSLSFPTGEAAIDARYSGLLAKVRQAIMVFPGSTVSVQGHTDSFGSERGNLRLSQERAEAVRASILVDSQLEPSRIESVGFGESRPIASNDTEDGRAKNRRIEVVITPAPDLLSY